jgi:CubicO group peptidase (beta-lactamase class C family)
VTTWTSAECAAAWGVQPATWLGYVSRGQAPPPLPDPDEHGRRRWDPDAVRAFPRPGVGRSRAAATPENEALVAAMTQVADELDALRARQRDLAREARAGGLEVRAIARALRVSPQTVYGWLDG